jgi:hypothetical protein
MPAAVNAAMSCSFVALFAETFAVVEPDADAAVAADAVAATAAVAVVEVVVGTAAAFDPHATTNATANPASKRVTWVTGICAARALIVLRRTRPARAYVKDE